MTRPTPTNPAAADEVLAYLDQLEAWTSSRADLLLALDESARGSGTPKDQLDVSVAFVTWRAIGAIADELRELLPAPPTAASRPSAPGRTAVDAAAALIAAPVVDPDGAALASDPAEACSIVDRLIENTRRSLDDAAAEFEERASLQAATRDHLAAAGRLAELVGEQVRHVAELATRCRTPELDLDSLRALAAEAAAAHASLEATDADRRQILGRLDDTEADLERLTEREATVTALAARCRDRIANAPNLAIPSVVALGPAPRPTRDRPGGTGTQTLPWPSVRTAAIAWLTKLDRVAAAFDEAERRFAQPLDERDELRGLLQGFRAKAAANRIAEDPAIDALYETARQILWSAPCDLTAARAGTTAYVEAINATVEGRV